MQPTQRVGIRWGALEAHKRIEMIRQSYLDKTRAPIEGITFLAIESIDCSFVNFPIAKTHMKVCMVSSIRAKHLVKPTMPPSVAVLFRTRFPLSPASFLPLVEELVVSSLRQLVPPLRLH